MRMLEQSPQVLEMTGIGTQALFMSLAACKRSKTDSPSLQGLKFAQSLDIESPSKFMTPQHAEQSTDMSLLTNWYVDVYGRKNV